MKHREYRPTDYSELCAWWRGHGWGDISVPESCIPENTIIIETDDGVPAACVTIYVYQGVPMGRVGFVVSNPELDVRERASALRMMARETVRRLKELGLYHVQAFYEEHSLQRLFVEAGFVITRKTVAEMTWAPVDHAVSYAVSLLTRSDV